MSNKTYDTLKFITAIVLPALATLIITVFKIWGLPYGEAIAGTITAIDCFLGAILQISSVSYGRVEAIREHYEAEQERLIMKLDKQDDEARAKDGFKEL